MMLELVKGGIVLVLLLALLVGLSYAQRRWQIHPELSRKSVHITMGLVTLSFPWLFTSVYTVPILTLIAVTTLVLIRSVRLFRSQAGQALSAVKRHSYGELYFPIGVATVYYFSNGDPLLYITPVLILTFADAFAAIVGRFGGRLFFTTSDGHKTLEGSFTFLAMTMLCIAGPFLFLSDIDPLRIVLIALLLGLLLMLFEAVSWSGIDNLLIPVFSFLLLREYLSLEASSALLHLAILGLLIGVLIIWQRYSSLRDEALLAAVLYGYFSWAIAGTAWLLVAFVMLAVYPFITPDREKLHVRHGMHVIFYVAGSGVVWLFVDRVYDSPMAYFLYCLSFASHLSLVALFRFKSVRTETSSFRLGLICAIKSTAVIFAPFWLFSGAQTISLWLLPPMLLQLILLNAILAWTDPKLGQYEHLVAERWYTNTILVFAACCISILPYRLVMEDFQWIP